MKFSRATISLIIAAEMMRSCGVKSNAENARKASLTDSRVMSMMCLP